MAQSVSVDGLRELNRAFARADKQVKAEFRGTLRKAAEPVRQDAESLAVAGIRNIGEPWSRMRVGVTRSLVYVAPRQRGRKTGAGARRPNLKGLLLERSLEPALENNIDGVTNDVEHMLNGVAGDWGRF